MNNNHKDPSLFQHTRESLREEVFAWFSLFRTEWPWLILILIGLTLLVVVTKPLPPRDVYLAVGQAGSRFESIGEKFVPYFQSEGVRLHLVNTKGSAANLDTLLDTKNEVSAALVVGGVGSRGQFPNVESLGSLEYIPLWVFYRGKPFDGKGAYHFFATKRVAIGNVGSASATVLKKILAITGIDLKAQENFKQIPDKEAVQNLVDGEIDAMCIMDGINSPNVQDLLTHPELHILSMPTAAAYAKKLPFFSVVEVPMGSLDLKAPRPLSDITLLASSGTLLIDKNMHPAIQQIFLAAADEVIKEESPFFGKQNTFPAYIDQTIPLSPVAKRFYNEGPPSFSDKLPLWLINYIDRVWLLLLGGFAVIYPLIKLFPSYRRIRSVLLIEEAYDQINQIEREAAGIQNRNQLALLVERLNILDSNSRDTEIASEEQNRNYTMKSALNLIRQKIIERIDQEEDVQK